MRAKYFSFAVQKRVFLLLLVIQIQFGLYSSLEPLHPWHKVDFSFFEEAKLHSRLLWHDNDFHSGMNKCLSLELLQCGSQSAATIELDVRIAE